MNKKYEIIFAIALLLIMGVSLFYVSGALSSLYERVDDRKSDQDNLRIGTAFYMTKIKHWDREDTLSIGIIDGSPSVLTIKEDAGVYTHVFIQDGALYETTMAEGMKPDKEFAFFIAEVDDVEMFYEGSTLDIKLYKSGDYREIKLLINSFVEVASDL